MATALDYCPTVCGGCDDDLPVITVTNCEEIGNELIDTVYIADIDAAAFTNVAQAGEWTTRLSQSATTANTIRAFKVHKGQKPFVEPTIVTSNSGKRWTRRSPKNIEGTDDNASVSNHEWHRKMNCKREVKIWFGAGKYIYGGNSGIQASFISTHGIIDNGDRPAEGWNWRCDWEAACEPEKAIRPI